MTSRSAILGVLGGCILCTANVVALEPGQFLAEIDAMKPVNSNQLSVLEGSATANAELGILQNPNAIRAVLTLAALREWQLLEYHWWKTEDSNARLAIVSAIECLNQRDVDTIPDFRRESKRFNSLEQKERLAEIDYCEANRSAIAKRLASKLADMGREGDLKRSYTKTAAQAER